MKTVPISKIGRIYIDKNTLEGRNKIFNIVSNNQTTNTEIKERLCLGNFIINKPETWDLDYVKLEIKDYDYDSTTISIDDLRILHKYIGDILNNIKTK